MPPSAGSGIRPAGNDTNFDYTRAMRPDQLSPRSSSSALADSDTDSSSDSDSDMDDHSLGPSGRSRSVSSERQPRSQRQSRSPPSQSQTERIVSQGAFTVEELSDFGESDTERVGVVRPDAIEYAESERSRSRSRHTPVRKPVNTHPDIDQSVVKDLGNLTCMSDSEDLTDYDEAEYREFLIKRREEKRRRRMTSGSIGKRTITESIGSDTDREDLKIPPFPYLGVDDPTSSARRLRRRVGDRRSLQFQDPPAPRIDELDEPESDEDPLLISEALARELPYYEYVSMQIDSP